MNTTEFRVCQEKYKPTNEERHTTAIEYMHMNKVLFIAT